MTRILSLLCGLAIATTILGQKEQYAQDEILQLFENQSQVESISNIEDVIEQLYLLQFNPININEAGKEDFENLYLLNDLQINDILSYRQDYGPFLSLYELQAVPNLDVPTIKSILPFISLDDKRLYSQKNSRKLKDAQKLLLTRWQYTFEEQKGFKPNSKGEIPFLGDRNKFYTRLRISSDAHFKVGFLAEKDVGEPMFYDKNVLGSDYLSFHLYYKDISPLIKTLALGDYSASFGQGLILQNTFQYGKGSDVLSIKRNNKLQSYSSAGENEFFRGVGLQLRLNSSLDLTVLSSRNAVDGNLVYNDDSTTYVSSLQTSGLHRTLSEREDKNSVVKSSNAIRLQYHSNTLTLAYNALHTHLSQDYIRRDRPENMFLFRGNNLFNTSVDFDYRQNGFNTFGEFAVSQNGGIAFNAGALSSLSSKVSLGALYRNFGVEYQNLDAKAFAENDNTNNEKGFYLGLEYSPKPQLTMSGYIDFYRHPWARYLIEGPSNGIEYFFRLDVYKKRDFQFYLQFRNEKETDSFRVEDQDDRVLADQSIQKLRVHFTKHINPKLQSQTRVEFSRVSNPYDGSNFGWLAYQNFGYGNQMTKLKAHARFAIFNIDDFDGRIYTYENDVYLKGGIPFAYNHGFRTYLLLKFNIANRLELESKFATTKYFNLDNISSGQNQIEGSIRNDITVQLQWKL